MSNEQVVSSVSSRQSGSTTRASELELKLKLKPSSDAHHIHIKNIPQRPSTDQNKMLIPAKLDGFVNTTWKHTGCVYVVLQESQARGEGAAWVGGMG